MVSAYSKPGSRRCTCMSMNPGVDDQAGSIEFFRARDVQLFADARDLSIFD